MQQRDTRQPRSPTETRRLRRVPPADIPKRRCAVANRARYDESLRMQRRESCTGVGEREWPGKGIDSEGIMLASTSDSHVLPFRTRRPFGLGRSSFFRKARSTLPSSCAHDDGISLPVSGASCAFAGRAPVRPALTGVKVDRWGFPVATTRYPAHSQDPGLGHIAIARIAPDPSRPEDDRNTRL